VGFEPVSSVHQEILFSVDMLADSNNIMDNSLNTRVWLTVKQDKLLTVSNLEFD